MPGLKEGEFLICCAINRKGLTFGKRYRVVLYDGPFQDWNFSFYVMNDYDSRDYYHADNDKENDVWHYNKSFYSEREYRKLKLERLYERMV